MPLPLAPAPVVRSHGGMVASADALATQAGVAVLRAGGGAVDAAIATNAVMTVVAPHLCGLGGDLFALVHGLPDQAAPSALDASGRAGSGARAATLRDEGHAVMVMRGDVRTVTVPGCVDGWLALHERHGRLPLAQLFAGAIVLARDGFPASPLLAASAAVLPDPAPAGSEDLTAPRPRPGHRVRRPGIARTLEAIAGDGRAGFYGGEFGRGMLALAPGWFSADDLGRVQADWVEPLTLPAFGGHGLWTLPPTSQGYLTLAAAWIADGLSLPDDPDDPRFAHLLVEAARAAGWDRPAVLHEGADGAALVDPSRLGPRRDAIDPDRAAAWPVPAASGDTTYLCVVDGDGVGVSLIQSNASGFGSWVFEPTTGIGLHNRGLGFSLEPGHPAELAPGRRPPHTLCPAIVTRPDGGLAAVVGTMGGDAQPQILVQVLARLLHLGQSPGATVAAPRWVLEGAATGFDTWTSPGGPGVKVESHAPPGWIPGLTALGHRVRTAPAFGSDFGHAHVIALGDDGLCRGAADPRAIVGSCAPA